MNACDARGPFGDSIMVMADERDHLLGVGGPKKSTGPASLRATAREPAFPMLCGGGGRRKGVR
jgi:hypothetical protein